MKTQQEHGAVDFGRRLIDTGDLDPIYVALAKLDLPPERLNRWLLVYWCCYDAGVSSYIAEAPTVGSFWERMQSMARNEEEAPCGGRWRRAAERRHWRGLNAKKSLADLRERYESRPEEMATYCAHGEVPGQVVLATQTTCAAIMKRAREHVGFGSWIGFKIADMLERVAKVSVSFKESEVFLFEAPREAAEWVWMDHHPMGEETQRIMRATMGCDVKGVIMGKAASKEAVRWSVEYLTKKFEGFTAPPHHDRAVGLQEVETILCKWKSHRNGHYPVGRDIAEIRHGLLPWYNHSPLARSFLAAMPPEVAQ